MPHKIGAYVRVSTEEQAQVVDGSVESQQHRLKGFVELKNQQEGKWGKVQDFYIDDGYSAKDTRRPAYQRMMKDIRAGKIDLILVTDISRLSRNIPDFCVLLKDLETHRAKFLSVKEQFDTSTPVGEMMIYNMINLAQFERKQTSERVSMNFHSRALRGLMNGGNPILGYDKDPTNPGKFVVNEVEAPAAREIFALYLETGSLQETARRLSAKGFQRKIAPGRKYRHALDGRWTVGAMRALISNYTYVGQREVNKHNKDEDQGDLKPWQRYQIVKAAWPAIIDEKVFFAAQKLLVENWTKERARFAKGQRRHFLLSGVIRCGDCGMALIGQTSHGKHGPHRYYGHKMIVGETIACKLKRFRAEEVEAAVSTHLTEILLRAGHLDNVEENIRKSVGAQDSDLVAERDRVQKEILGLDADIDSAMNLHAKMDKNPEVINLIQEKLEKLAEKKRRLVSHRESILTRLNQSNDAKEARHSIEDQAKEIRRGWAKASIATKKRLIRRLIDKLIYTREGLHSYFVTAKDIPTVQPSPQMKMASESSSGAIPQNIHYLKKHPKQPVRLTADESVLRVRNGGGGGNRTRVRSNSTSPLYKLSL